MSEAAPTPAYDERGSGRPVVFSHGTLMDRTMFDPQVEALAGSYRVIAYDHPARTGGWAEQYSLGDLVDNCIGLLDALEIERCVLAGMSMGGFMAIELALRHPERLDGLIIIDAIAGDYSPEERVLFKAEFDKLDIDGSVPREWAEWVAPLVFGSKAFERNPALVEHWLGRWCTYPARSVLSEARAWIDKDDRTDAIRAIQTPTLVVHGQDDVVLALDRAAPMAELIPNARLVAIADAGHSANLEQPGPVNAAIGEFLSGLA